MNVQPFRPVGASQNLTVTSTAASLTLSTVGAQASVIRVLTQGSQLVFMASGIGSATATSLSTPLTPNVSELFCKGLDDTFSFVTTTTTSVVYIQAGEGAT